MIKVILFKNNLVLISRLEEVGSEMGEPDCKLIEPFVVGKQDTLSPWLVDATTQNEFMISSDKILTLIDPKPTLLEEYQNLIK